MDLGISGKKAIICASSRGLGKACAHDLAKEGVEIFINGVNKENLAKTEKEFKDKGFKVTSVLGLMEESSTRSALLAACPDPDILINNSGGPPPGNFFDWTEEDFLSAIKSNFTQSALLMQAVIPRMKEKKFGRIINITSAMVKNPHLIMGLSTSARSGLHGLSKASDPIPGGQTKVENLPLVIKPLWRECTGFGYPGAAVGPRTQRMPVTCWIRMVK